MLAKSHTVERADCVNRLRRASKDRKQFLVNMPKNCYNISMIRLVIRLSETLIAFALIALIYAVVSWNIFGQPTFLSSGIDCMPSPNIQNGLNIIEEKASAAKPFFRDGSMFGNYCATR